MWANDLTPGVIVVATALIDREADLCSGPPGLGATRRAELVHSLVSSLPEVPPGSRTPAPMPHALC